MKRLVLLLSILASPMLIKASHWLEGTWVTQHSNQRINIDNIRNGILVYGIERGDALYFRRVSESKYRSDCGGFVLRRREHNRIKLYDYRFRYNKVTNFYRARNAFSDNGQCHSGRGYDFEERDRRFDGPRHDDRFYQRQPTHRSAASLSQEIEGTWYSPQLNETVLILNDRGDLKVKIRGKTDWVRFSPTSFGVYQDRKSNIYTFNNDGTLTWSDRTNGGRTFTLRKESDQIKW